MDHHLVLPSVQLILCLHNMTGDSTKDYSDIIKDLQVRRSHKKGPLKCMLVGFLLVWTHTQYEQFCHYLEWVNTFLEVFHQISVECNPKVGPDNDLHFIVCTFISTDACLYPYVTIIYLLWISGWFFSSFFSIVDSSSVEQEE